MVGQDSQSKFTASREINSLNHNPTHAEAWLLPIGHGPVGMDSWYGFFSTAADASPTIKVCNSEAGPAVFFLCPGPGRVGLQVRGVIDGVGEEWIRVD